MTNFNNAPDKHSPIYQENLIKTARYSQLMVVLFTVVNLAMLLVGSDRYFLFSASIPYYMTYFGYMFDNFTFGTYTLTAFVMASAMVAIYAVCWLLSKKHIGWLIATLVLISIDTLGMLVLMLLFDNFMGWLLEIVFHVWVIVSLSRGIAATIRLKNLPPETEIPQYILHADPEEQELL